MINKVFSYSDEVGKKNGIKKDIILNLLFISFIFVSIIFLIMFFNNYSLLILLIGFFIIILISLKFASNYSMAKLIGYAVDNDGNLLQIILLNHIDNLSTSGNVLGNSFGNDLGKNIGTLSDSMNSINKLNDNMASMSNPEFVLKVIENSDKS